MKRKLAIAAAIAAATLAVGGTAYATSQDSGTPATMVDSEQKLGNGQEADVDVVEGDEASTTTTTMVDSEQELGNGQEADIEYETPAAG
ncbi:hypothetical protein [Streptomyces vastus]|uniref:Secreted protein n=1 Tax=Streptomyces vastus TaxID=285451 RepID=A0ABN3RK25_9ACTN